MKRYSCLFLMIVLTAAMMTGCGCTGPSRNETVAPTVLPTNEEVTRPTETTRATTEATTEPTVQTTLPSQTADNGNGLLDDQTTGSTEATSESAVGNAARGMIR